MKWVYNVQYNRTGTGHTQDAVNRDTIASERWTLALHSQFYEYFFSLNFNLFAALFYGSPKQSYIMIFYDHNSMNSLHQNQRKSETVLIDVRTFFSIEI